MRNTSSQHRVIANTRNIVRIIAIAVVAAPCTAQTDTTTVLEPVLVTATRSDTLDPIETAPSQGNLNARSPESTVNNNYIRNFTSPAADYTQVLTMTPGVFSYSPNGNGLTDAKIRLRGLSDDFINFSFDGIPFNDTNGVSHHSATFFPAQFLGGAVVDRGPGTAATIGQATFGGSVDLLSRILEPEQRTSVSAMYGSWDTRLLNVEYESGRFGPDGGSNLLVNAHELKSDGYQTYNEQTRKAAFLKYQQALSSSTTLTLVGSVLNLKNHTPSSSATPRSNYDIGDYRTLLTTDPTKGNYVGYNFDDLDVSFVYAGIESRLGGGWVLEDKLYRYYFNNQRNYNNGAAVTATSGLDRLNAYTTWGNVLRLSQDSSFGTFHVGLWLDHANSTRYQIPSNPHTWVDVPAPTFSETYTTTTTQPYAEYTFKVGDALRITPGIKYAAYKQDFTHFQDNGGAVGPLGGVFNPATNTITGGLASIDNSITYTDWLPSFDVHYAIQPNWTAYAQYAYGDEIPSTSVFDVKNALVSPPPKATKAQTVQIGTVINAEDFTAAADIYHTRLDGAYTALPPDSAGNIGYVLSGIEISQGIEGEINLALGAGFGLYLNGTLGSLKYQNGQWVAGAPQDTEVVALNFQRWDWSASLSANRAGKMYGDAKDGTHQAFTIDPVVVINLFVSYTAKRLFGFDKQTKFQLGVSNLFDRHNIVGVATPAAGSTSAQPSPNDLLTVIPGRSVLGTITVDF